MKKQRIVNLKELVKINNKLGNTLELLQTLDPFIEFKNRYQYKKTYKFIEELYYKVDKLIINMTDNEEIKKKY